MCGGGGGGGVFGENDVCKVCKDLQYVFVTLTHQYGVFIQ